MSVTCRNGLLILAVALAGCGKSDTPAGKPGKSKTGPQTATAPVSAGASECVIGVEEMS